MADRRALAACGLRGVSPDMGCGFRRKRVAGGFTNPRPCPRRLSPMISDLAMTTHEPRLAPMSGRAPLAPLAALVALLASGLAGCGDSQRQQAAPPAPAVTVA